MTGPVTSTGTTGTSGGTTAQSSFSTNMQAMQQESENESMIEMQTNLVMNRNNAMAQTAANVGRS